MTRDLRQFLSAAKTAGSKFYVEVKRPLKLEFEVPVIQEKLAREGRFPVVYCAEIVGSKLPLVSNLFASRSLMGLAMDLDPTQARPADIFREYRRRQALGAPVQPAARAESPVKEIVLRNEQVDLGLLPIPKHAPLDSGPYITAGSMICRHPDTGILNVGVYRHEVKGKNSLGCMINRLHHGAYIARQHAELGRKMEVAIFIGHHPAAFFGGSVYTGEMGVNELEVMAGFLGEPLQVVPAETVDLPVPAQAEIVIEGMIDPSRMATDGPLAEYTGYYGEAQKPCYLIEVTALTMRGDAIYHDLSPLHREFNQSIVMSYEAAIHESVKRIIPGLKAVYIPPSGVGFASYISIAKHVEGEGVRAGLAALAGSSTGCKLVIVVDDDVNVYNEEDVLWTVATRVKAHKDVVIIPGATGTHLDPTAYDETGLKSGQMTTKMIIDATRPMGPYPIRAVPPEDILNSMRLEDYLR